MTLGTTVMGGGTTWRWVLVAAAFAALCSPGRAQQNDYRITTVEELRRAQPGTRELVEVTATVCYCDPIWHFLFLIDDGHGIFAVGNAGLYRPGDRVRVQAAIWTGHGSPILAGKQHIEKVGEESLPEPPRVDLAGWSNDAHLSDPRATNWIEVEGFVEQAVLIDGVARLWCRDPKGTRFTATVSTESTREQLWQMVHARIAIRGALGLLLDRRNNVVGPLLLAQSWSQVEVLEPGDLVDMQREPRIVGHLENKSSGSFHACGQVSHVEERRIFVDDGAAAGAFRIASTFDTPFDSYVHLFGIYEHGKRVVKLVSPGTPSITIWPKSVAITELTADQVGRRVSIVAEVTGDEMDAHLLHVRSDTDFAVVKLRDSIDTSSLDLSEAREIHATGVLLPERVRGAPTIGVVREEDLQILSRRFVLPSQVLIWVLCGFLAIAGLGATMVMLLRRQVTARTREHSELAAQLRASQNSIDDGLIAVDNDDRIFAVNRAANRILQSELAPGETTERLLACWSNVSDETTRIRELTSDPQLDHNGHSSREVRLRGSEHGVVRVTVSPIQLDGEKLGHLWVLKNETQVRTLQAELLHAQKMEAVGALTGAIAHDFNNLLTVITGTLGVLRSTPDGFGSEHMELIDAAEGAAFRAGDTVRKLLSFSRKNKLETQPCEPNAVIDSLRPLLRHGFDASIEFEFHCEDGLPTLSADPSQLEHVLLNLCINARDAMPQGGVITIGAEPDLLDGQPAVAFYVRDTGSGIANDVKDKIFEPFFTTKTPDKGSGLGLATSFGIVRQHGGTLTCTSEAGSGSEFRVVLPIATAEPVVLIDRPDIPDEFSGRETILAIDDEWVVRTVTINLLQNAGYNVLSAEDGTRGLALLEREHATIDLVLVDVTMPGMTGHEVARIVRDRYPEIPVVMCSGYFEPDGTQTAGAPFVAKPFKARDLLGVVRDALDAGERIRAASRSHPEPGGNPNR